MRLSLDALLRMSPEQALLRVRNASRVPATLCKGLADYVFQLRHFDPALMPRWGRVADAAAEKTVDPRAAGIAKAHFGNALRVNGDFTGAKAALADAEKILPASDPLIHEFRASLLLGQRDCAGALEELRRAFELRSANGDEIGLAKVLIQAAMVSDLTRQPEEAVRLLEQAIEKLTRAGAEGRDFLLIALQNLGDCLISAGQLGKARHLLEQIERPSLEFGTHFAVKFKWLQGRLASWDGDDKEARRLYEAARKGYRELGMLREVALVTLHLAAQHYQYCRYATCAREALKVVPLLESLGLNEDTQVTDLLGQIANRSCDLEQAIWTLSSTIALSRQKW
jgi:tetratricopeptide (TPR) repeat protein